MFRGKTFVLALDGSVIAHANFPNLLQDIAVLRSVNIRVVLVHGIGSQIKKLARSRDIEVTQPHGEGPTDLPTLEIARDASDLVARTLVAGLLGLGLRPVPVHAARGTAVGIVRGEDQLFTGKVDKLDVDLIRDVLALSAIPILSPLLYSSGGDPLRINSDRLASDVAIALDAMKLIYLVPHKGLTVGDRFIRNVPVEDVHELLKANHHQVDERVRSKAAYAVRTIDAGIPRAHLIDGTLSDGLLTELFSKVGIGTMIHGNAYQKIREATAADAPVLAQMTREGVADDSLRATSQAAKEGAGCTYVYEIDGSLIGCVSIGPIEGGNAWELGSLFVQPFYHGKGVGRRLVEFALLKAQEAGADCLYALTTQSLGFFETIGGFEIVDATDLPESRGEALRQSGRRSRILKRDFRANPVSAKPPPLAG
jgi:amino-acid N-acetyltransferase